MTRHAVLDNKTHRDLRIRTDAGAELGDDIMATLTVPSEFRRVPAHFPILFRRETGRDDFTALAMFGFQTGENLFRSEEHTSELQSLMRISYAVFCLKQKRELTDSN